MAFNTPLTKSENLVFGRGVVYFAPFDEDGNLMGERDLGEVPSLSLSVESERFRKDSARTGIATNILDTLIRVTISGAMTIEDMSVDNQAFLIAGSVQINEQAATPVTNERIRNAQPDRQYQLGVSNSNPGGVREVSSVTVGLYELVNAAARVNSTPYALGDIFKSSTNVFLVTTAGTTAGSAPSYTTTNVGDATTDGTAVVKYLGTTSNYTVSTHYELSSEAARVGIKATGALAEACELYTDVTEGYLSLNVGYTPAIKERRQVVTTGSPNITGRLHFIADNATGDNRDLIIPSCSLAPSGEAQFITGDAIQSFGVEIGVNSLNSTVPQIIIDGRPYTP